MYLRESFYIHFRVLRPPFEKGRNASFSERNSRLLGGSISRRGHDDATKVHPRLNRAGGATKKLSLTV